MDILFWEFIEDSIYIRPLPSALRETIYRTQWPMQKWTFVEFSPKSVTRGSLFVSQYHNHL
jgi:hypothetical protein